MQDDEDVKRLLRELMINPPVINGYKFTGEDRMSGVWYWEHPEKGMAPATPYWEGSIGVPIGVPCDDVAGGGNDVYIGTVHLPANGATKEQYIEAVRPLLEIDDNHRKCLCLLENKNMISKDALGREITKLFGI
jgi:hypothetical protein